jgi:hypothetical protein
LRPAYNDYFDQFIFSRLLMVPLAIALGALTFATDWDLALRVEWCEDELTAYAQSVAPDRADWTPRQIGSLEFEMTEAKEGGVYLYHFKRGGGIAHLPPTANPIPQYRVTGHLSGDWYRVKKQ